MTLLKTGSWSVKVPEYAICFKIPASNSQDTEALARCCYDGLIRMAVTWKVLSREKMRELLRARGLRTPPGKLESLKVLVGDLALEMQEMAKAGCALSEMAELLVSKVTINKKTKEYE